MRETTNEKRWSRWLARFRIGGDLHVKQNLTSMTWDVGIGVDTNQATAGDQIRRKG